MPQYRVRVVIPSLKTTPPCIESTLITFLLGTHFVQSGAEERFKSLGFHFPVDAVIQYEEIDESRCREAI